MPCLSTAPISTRRASRLSASLALSLVTVLLWSAAPATPPAQHLNSSTALGMGQSGRGVARANTGLIYNPAGMSASITYAVEAMYQRTSSEQNILGLTIVDSKMRASQDRLALGLGYGQVITAGETTAYEGRLALALPVITAGPNGGPELHIGAGGRYLYDELSKADDLDVDLGALLNIGAGFNVGVVADSLLESNREKRFGGGLGFVHQSLSLALDYLQPSSGGAQLWSGGAEFLVGQSLILRGGYERHFEGSDKPTEWVSGGLAILDGGSGRGQLSTAYRQSLSSGVYTFNLSFILFVDLPAI